MRFNNNTAGRGEAEKQEGGRQTEKRPADGPCAAGLRPASCVAQTSKPTSFSGEIPWAEAPGALELSAALPSGVLPAAALRFCGSAEDARRNFHLLLWEEARISSPGAPRTAQVPAASRPPWTAEMLDLLELFQWRLVAVRAERFRWCKRWGAAQADSRARAGCFHAPPALAQHSFARQAPVHCCFLREAPQRCCFARETPQHCLYAPAVRRPAQSLLRSRLWEPRDSLQERGDSSARPPAF